MRTNRIPADGTRRALRWAAALCAAGLMVVSCGSSDSTDDGVLTSDEVAEQPAGNADEGSPATQPPNSGIVTVTGERLPEFDGDTSDVAGRVAPTVIAQDLLTGDEVRIETDGRPMVIGFFAHWCPHCQSEVSELTAWQTDNELPDGVDYYAVSTFFDPGRENFPPDAWFEREGWSLPVVSDTEAYEVAATFGVPSIPFYVFVNADGTIASRAGGNVAPDDLAAAMSSLFDGG